jgi:hypothetical protein
MKHLRLAFFAALLGVFPAAASPVGDIAGTWECRQPGIEYRNKPPILYVAETGGDQVSIEVDGFAREIYGRSEMAADQGGWWKVRPAQGQEFLIKPEGMKQRAASMGLRFADAKADYRCLRLPPSGATTFAPAAAPATESAPPASSEPSPQPPAEPAAPQAGMPSEGAPQKPY